MWKQLDVFPEYEVSDGGEVRRIRSRRVLKPQINQSGVPYVGLMTHDGVYSRALARLVAKEFIPEDRKPFDTPINLDGDRLNCAVDNLMWRPRWFAYQYHRQFAAPYLNHIARPVRLSGSSEVHSSSLTAACRYGLLEHDVVYSIIAGNPCWPGYLYFEVVE